MGKEKKFILFNKNEEVENSIPDSANEKIEQVSLRADVFSAQALIKAALGKNSLVDDVNDFSEPEALVEKNCDDVSQKIKLQTSDIVDICNEPEEIISEMVGISDISEDANFVGDNQEEMPEESASEYDKDEVKESQNEKVEVKSTKHIFGITPSFIFFGISLLTMELFLRISMDLNGSISGLFDISFAHTLFFSIFFAGLFDILCNISKDIKTRKTVASVMIFLVAVSFLIEYFLKQVYGNYMSIAVILMSAQNVVGSYSEVIKGTLFRGIPVIILYILPAIIAMIFGNKIFEKRAEKLKSFAVGFTGLVLAIVLVFGISKGTVTDKQYFTTHFDINKSTTRFGLMGSFCLDGVYAFTGTPQPDNNLGFALYIPQLDSMEYANVTDIDFNKLNAEHPDGIVRSINEYVSSVTPTAKNEYTGYFEGKNLIFITAEAFTPYVIDENDTPTLYKLANNGFIFTNYYQPSWMVSTSDGEYTLFNSLIPKYGAQSMYLGVENNWYYTLANSLKREGYATYAYHNHNYEYYNRHLTHPNLGYDVYMGMGNGMEEYVENQWPESDLEMMQSTVDLFVNSEKPFHVYYLTVSGHTEYNFFGNNMAYKNIDNISDTTSSDAVRAIKACNMELEYALESLMTQLEEAGVLDDTVIVMSADHYPYGLTDEAYNELAGKELDVNFERYHNQLIIYNSAMEENVTVDDYCCGVDVLPTLLNLFGIEYDSRLLMGSDVLSNAPQLVLFQDYSWITDKGRYEADSGEFYPADENKTVDNSYIQTISNIVSNKVMISKYILESDYYNIIFGN